MMPLIAYETLDALALLTATCRVFRRNAAWRGSRRTPSGALHWIEWSLALVTPLATRIGYDRAAAIAYQAFKERKTVRQVVLEQKLLPPEEVDRLFDPKGMSGA